MSDCTFARRSALSVFAPVRSWALPEQPVIHLVLECHPAAWNALGFSQSSISKYRSSSRDFRLREGIFCSFQSRSGGTSPPLSVHCGLHLFRVSFCLSISAGGVMNTSYSALYRVALRGLFSGNRLQTSISKTFLFVRAIML